MCLDIFNGRMNKMISPAKTMTNNAMAGGLYDGHSGMNAPAPIQAFTCMGHGLTDINTVKA